MSELPWFEVSKEGLARLLKRKGSAFILYELVQNAWDTNASQVTVTVEPVEGRPLVNIVVEDDDPDGFADLRHAFTLFAESGKKGDPTKRGRFNLGEKLVLAACQEAEILSTKGGVIFRDGGRAPTRKKLERGSVFRGTLRMTRDEMREMLDGALWLLPPIPTTINGTGVERRSPIRTFTTTLPTEVSDEEGFLRKTARRTEVRVYERRPGESAWIYEMGIPVVETDDPWTVEVMQKVPLNADRDNVTPAYQRELRVAVVNYMTDHITRENAASPTVQEALCDPRISNDAVERILTEQYGEKRAVFDPSDPEANHRAVAEGYTVVPGSAFTKDQWLQIRRGGALTASGKFFPPPKPYSDDPDARPAKIIPEDKWTAGMRGIAEYARDLAWKLIARGITIVMEVEPTQGYGANYGHRTLTFNVGRLGHDWFNHGVTEAVNDLLLHELGHEYESNHLSAAYYKALTKLGAKLARLVLADPTFFQKHGMVV